jgi:hypothetical protein
MDRGETTDLYTGVHGLVYVFDVIETDKVI